MNARIDDAERAAELKRLEAERDEQQVRGPNPNPNPNPKPNRNPNPNPNPNQRLHELALEQLEAKASAALKSLEEQHAEEVARIQHDAAHTAAEQNRLKGRLAQLAPQIERAEGGAPDLAAARAGSKDASEWVAERLAFMLIEDSKNRQRGALRRWAAMAEFKEGLELGSGVGGKKAAEAVAASEARSLVV